MTTTTARPRTSRMTVARIAVATVSALVANLIVFAIGTAADVTFDVESPQPISAVTVALFTVIPLVLGAVVVALVSRRWSGFQHFAAWAGLAFALLTIAGSFGAAGDTTTALTLAAMHLVVGAAWFLGVRPRENA